METRKSEELDALAPEQYGSRKVKSTDIQALNTCLFYYLIRLKRVLATSTFTDLIYNYNLVVNRIASLSLQKYNTPKEPIICTFSTLQNMEHSVRIAFGDSDSSY